MNKQYEPITITQIFIWEIATSFFVRLVYTITPRHYFAEFITRRIDKKYKRYFEYVEEKILTNDLVSDFHILSEKEVDFLRSEITSIIAMSKLDIEDILHCGNFPKISSLFDKN